MFLGTASCRLAVGGSVLPVRIHLAPASRHKLPAFAETICCQLRTTRLARPGRHLGTTATDDALAKTHPALEAISFDSHGAGVGVVS